MSNYKDFIKEFPKRCSDVLCHVSTGRKDLDVTILLMTASTAFVFPYERLRGKQNKKQESPEYHTKPELAAKLKELQSQKFLSSQLWPHSSFKSWEKGLVDLSAYHKNVDTEGWLKTEPLCPNCICLNTTLTILRNALAHGKVYTRQDSKGQIDGLVFLNINQNGQADALCVSPDDFKKFLINWVAFLQENAFSSLSNMVDDKDETY